MCNFLKTCFKFNFSQNGILIQKFICKQTNQVTPPEKFNKLKNILINIFFLYCFNFTLNSLTPQNRFYNRKHFKLTSGLLKESFMRNQTEKLIRFKNKNTCNKKRLQKGRFKNEKEFFFKNYGTAVGFGNG